MRGRFALLGAGLLAGVIALAGCASSANSSTGSPGEIRIALNNTNDSLAVVVADQQGFFAKHGIKATTTTLNDISLVPSLLGKQYDIGISVAPIMIRSAASRLPIVAISGNTGDSAQHEEVQIFVRPGTELNQLRGKRIGAPTLTGNLNIATRAWLAKGGVDPSAEQFVQVPTPNMLDELKAGQIDAAELIYPFISLAKQAGMVSLGDPERALSEDFVGGTYFTATSSWASANPTVVSGFKAALDEAGQWIAANPDQAYQVAATYTKVTPDQARLAPLSEYATNVSADDLRIWGDAMRQFGGFNGNLDYNKIVFTPAS